MWSMKTCASGADFAPLPVHAGYGTWWIIRLLVKLRMVQLRLLSSLDVRYMYLPNLGFQVSGVRKKALVLKPDT